MNIEKIRALRINTSQLDLLGVKKVVTRIAITKPGPATFFRVHRDPERTLEVAMYEDNGGKELYVVWPQVVSFFGKNARSVRLYLAIDRNNNIFLTPLTLMGSDGKWDQWHESRSAALKHSEEKWIRMQSNMRTSSYDVFVAQGDLPEPDWPAYSFDEILETAFEGRVIEDELHPVVRSLLGLA